jgi:hypothetical protein
MGSIGGLFFCGEIDVFLDVEVRDIIQCYTLFVVFLLRMLNRIIATAKLVSELALLEGFNLELIELFYNLGDWADRLTHN